jgi:hypothetical protein
MILLSGCESQPVETAIDSPKRVQVKVKTDSDGLTVEQKNISRRLTEDNKPGAVKHLYLISPYSGQAIMYSTVNGKVTSSEKRLTPKTVGCTGGEYVYRENRGIAVALPNEGTKNTPEVLGDDGTYGDSYQYIYWWDTKGRYHQVIPGNCIVLITDKPLVTNKVTIDLRNVQ